MSKKANDEQEKVARMAAWRVELPDETLGLPDGRRVRWGDVTVEEHRERAALLRKHLEAT